MLKKIKQSKLAGSTTFSINTMIKRATIAAVAFTIISFGAFAASSLAKESEKMTTVYYVYSGDQYIGTVSNKSIVEQILNEKIAEVKDIYKSMELSIGSQITYIPEKMLSSLSNANDSEVIKQLKEKLTVQADAVALTIDEKPIAYVENKEAAEKVMKDLKLKFVSKKQLAALEKSKENPEEKLPALKGNKTRLLDIYFSKDISFTNGKVSPDEILSEKNAVKFLTKGTLEEKIYKVKEGDVLGTIANDHNMKLEQLLSLNHGLKEDSLLNIDQEINVTVTKPIVKVIVEKETNNKEKIDYEREVIEDSSMYKGDHKVKQKGKKGKRSVTYLISEENGVVVKKKIIKEKIIKKPVDYIVIKGTKETPSRGNGTFSWPASGYISSKQGYRWGKMHKGIDIAGPSNRTITAADNGVVVSAGWDGGYGNKIIIDHQNGFRTVYAHLDSISVKVGQVVPRGSAIGIMGSTGDSTGVHLHFEIYLNGSLKNPLDYL